MDDLRALEEWAGPLLAQLAPAQQRALALRIGHALRRSTRSRIREQLNPDGTAFAPRKRDASGRIRRSGERMFQRIAEARNLKVTLTPSGVSVGWVGRIARVAGVHQRGEVDRVVAGGPSVRYDVRELLGLTDSDRTMIRDMLIEHLGAG